MCREAVSAADRKQVRMKRKLVDFTMQNANSNGFFAGAIAVIDNKIFDESFAVLSSHFSAPCLSNSCFSRIGGLPVKLLFPC